MIHYTYTPSGQKIAQQLIDADGRVSTRRDYAGAFVYVNNNLAWINTSFGRIVHNDHGGNYSLLGPFTVERHLTDHLGNTRVVLKLHNDGAISVDQTKDYYPFGMGFMRVEDGSSSIFPNRYLYNGKEFQDDFELNWYDYGARFYDAQIARWHSVDPLAEKYYPISPYAYVANNPIRFIDPDGREIINAEEEKRSRYEKDLERQNKAFEANYNGDFDKKRSDFKNTSQNWRTYKAARREIRKTEKNLAAASEAAQEVQDFINNYQLVDPAGFAIMDNLVYKNDAGQEITLDVRINKGSESYTEFIMPLPDGTIPNNSINIYISDMRISSNQGAHEFGHIQSYSEDPRHIYNLAVSNPYHNCQDPVNRNHPLSITALLWQNLYNQYYRDFRRSSGNNN